MKSATPSLIPIPGIEGTTVTRLVFLLQEKRTKADGQEAPSFYEVHEIDLQEAVADGFRKPLLDKLAALSKLTPIALTTSSSPLPTEVERIEASTVPLLCDLLETITNAAGCLRPVQKIDDGFLNKLAAYAVIVESTQHQYIYFRKFLRSKVIEVGSPLGLLFHGGQLRKTKRCVFNFDELMDVMVIDKVAYVFQRTLFEDIFHYTKTVYRQDVKRAILCLKESGLIANIDDFVAACEADEKKLRKLADIGRKLTPQKLTWDMIKKFSGLGVDIDLDEVKQKIIYTERTAWKILKLLDDDYLRSIITDNVYEVQSKRPIRHVSKQPHALRLVQPRAQPVLASAPVA